MNLYDKRTAQNIIKTRVVKTRSFPSCDECKIEDKPCPKACPRITTELHLDDGYILYLSTKEIEYISKAYKEALLNLNTSNITEIVPKDDVPLDQVEDDLPF